MFYLTCKKCCHRVSGFLIKKTENIEINRSGSYVWQKDAVLINIKHRPHFWARQRHGSDTENQLSLVCPKCRVSIAEEVSDSVLTEKHIRVQLDLVEQTTVNAEFADQLYQIEQKSPIGFQYMDELLMLLKWNPEALKKQLRMFVRI
ncbi:MAG: hypothetical protein MUD08_06965 [Cytophagales bacterium]|jgi:hypothetical protein|nr:hypothetical protein [Cytophagales bacterium]